MTTTTTTIVRFTNLDHVYDEDPEAILDGLMFDIAEANEAQLERLAEEGVEVNAELVTDDQEVPDYQQQDPTQRVEGSDEPIDTDEDAESRTWGTDDDDAEEGMLDEQPDDLASDESRNDRQSYWGG